MEKKRYQKRTADRKRDQKRNLSIKLRLDKKCSICGKGIRVIVYRNKTKRGGHYFGKIGLPSKKEMQRVLKYGTGEVRVGNMILNVLRKDPKPYKYVEYWECPRCYWNY